MTIFLAPAESSKKPATSDFDGFSIYLSYLSRLRGRKAVGVRNGGYSCIQQGGMVVAGGVGGVEMVLGGGRCVVTR